MVLSRVDWRRAATIGVAAIAAACARKPPPPVSSAGSIASAGFVVDTATIARPLSFPAQLYVEHDAAVAARSAGVIDSLAVEVGSRVVAGQLLAHIESTDQEIAAAQADAALDNSERVVIRARGLSQARGMTIADSEQAEFLHRQAALSVRQARRALELTRITAPFAGVVVARYATPRRLVAAGDSLFRVAETEPLLARIRVPETVAVPIAIGTTAAVTGAGASGSARVFTVAPAIDPASGTREVVLRLDRAGRFIAGASVSVALGTERRVVVVAPREAIGPDGYVLVADGSRTALRAVVLGSDLGDGRVEVVSGVRVGERLARPGR
jgi:RND family efflux transporter MFP subunit